jgi:hypothetical protein
MQYTGLLIAENKVYNNNIAKLASLLDNYA